jgi:sortase A
MARIKIPRIALSAAVVNGDDERTLSRAVGHIPGTAPLGGTGTVGLAGHRDTFFRGLGRVRKNDEILIETPSATYRYRVADTAIVEPTDVEVLRPLKYPSLVLVTCYPFSFVGRAPQRYIVTARRAAAN